MNVIDEIITRSTKGLVLSSVEYDYNLNAIANAVGSILYGHHHDGVDSRMINLSGINVVEAVRVATTENITLSGEQIIDGISVLSGDRVLVKDQTDTSQNGVYTVIPSAAWVRAVDADLWMDYVTMSVFVLKGNVNESCGYYCNAGTVGTLDATAIMFVKSSSGTTGMTGGTVQTALAGPRVVLDINGFSVYDGSSKRGHVKTDGSGWFGGPDKFYWNSEGTVVFAGFGATYNAFSVTSGDNTTSLSAAGTYAIAAGTTSTPQFTVTHAGVLTATSGTVGGWHIDSQQIYMLNSGTPDSSPVKGIVLSVGLPGLWTKTKMSVYNGDGTEIYRLGNLSEFLDYELYPSATAPWGIGVGTVDSYMKYDVTNGLRIKGNITATTGSIGGWLLGTTVLKSAATGSARIELDQGLARISVKDSTNATKVAMGYLSGLAKHDGTGNWGVGDYGFWALAGDKLVIDGDGEYKSGDWIVQNDGAYLINNAAAQTIVRLGTVSGVKGLYIYDATAPTQNLLAKFATDGLYLGTPGSSSNYLSYTVAGGLVIKGVITITSGSVAWSSISGAGTPASYADVTGSNIAAGISGQGSLATANSVSWGSQIDSIPGFLTYPGSNATSGLYLTSSYLGYWYKPAGAGSWKTYMDNSGNFYLGGTSGSLTWNGTTLTVAGDYKTSATVGTTKGIHLDANNNELYFYGDANYSTPTVVRLASIGMNSSEADYIVGIFGSLDSRTVGLEARSENSVSARIFARAKGGKVGYDPLAVGLSINVTEKDVPIGQYVSYLAGQTIAVTRGSNGSPATVGLLSGLSIQYGNMWYSGTQPGPTSIMEGLRIIPYHSIAGAATTSRAIYLQSIASAGGTVANYYAIYQEDINAKNYWAGYHLAKGGIRVGSTDTDPGDNNLYVEGTASFVGAAYLGNTAGTADGHLYLNGNGSDSVQSAIFCSNGNLHIDSHNNDSAIYLNYYGGTGGVIFGNGASGSAASVSAAGVFTGSFSGNLTGNCSGSAATVTGASQTAITTVGSLSTPKLVTTGNNGYNVNDPMAADIVVGSDAGTRHDGNIMWWSGGSAVRVTCTNTTLYGSTHNTSAVGFALGGTVGDLSYFSGIVQVGNGGAAGDRIFRLHNTTHYWDVLNRSSDNKFYLQYDGVDKAAFDGSGNFGIIGSNAEKASGTTWANPSDGRLKENIVLANLDRCYEIVKTLPLKRYTLKEEAIPAAIARDRSKLGWIADDVETFFGKAIVKRPFTLNIPDGEEGYEEQVTELVEETQETKTIEIRSGIPVQVITQQIVQVERKLFDAKNVVDETGNIVLDHAGTPLTHEVPRTITKTRTKIVPEIIEDCRTLDADQLYAAMYGAIQKLMEKVEALENKV